MTAKKLRSPVAMLTFNRPDTTARVLAEIARAKPSKLLVVGDGPRAGNADDVAGVERTRALFKKLDWDCELVTNFSDTNLGCRGRVSSGVDWIFSQVEEAIILEDDCLPHPTFFPFCDELLERYRHDERVMQVSAGNIQNGRVHGDGSYYFSRYSPIWGWASWRRAWKHYDVDMKSFPKFRDSNRIASIIPDPRFQKVWMRDFTAVYEGKLNTWDFQWVYATFAQNGLAIIPNVNLVSNLGFDERSTHTSDTGNKFANMPMGAIDRIIHPSFVGPCQEADDYINKTFLTTPLLKRVTNRVGKIARRLTSRRASREQR